MSAFRGFLEGFVIDLIYYMCDFDFVQDTFERHRVVFTIGTSIASVATAWAGEFCLNSSFFFGHFISFGYVCQWFKLIYIRNL